MSQVNVGGGGSGTTPSNVPISFVTNSGTATAAANILNVLAADSTVNNDNGATTTASGNTLNVLLTNRATGTVTTANATPTTVLTFPLGAVAGVYFVEGNIVAFNTTDVAGGAYTFTSGMRTTGAAATELGTEFKDSFEEAAMAACDFNIVASGNSVIVQVIGIAAKSIDWNVCLTFRFVS